MVEFVIGAGIIWLVLTLFEPLVAYLDAGKACDRKYAANRIRRAQIYEEMAASHRASPLYQQMKQTKQNTIGKTRPYHQAGCAQLTSNGSKTGRSSAATGITSNSKPAGHPYGRIIQKRK